MPVYSYKGYDDSGASETGTIDAGNEKLAFDTLRSRGITVCDLTKGIVHAGADVPWFKRDIQIWSSELSFQEQAVVADFLATLFQAGLPASEVVRIAALSVEKTVVKRHFERVEQRVADGASFPDAFEAENTLFSAVFVSFLRVSDTSNTLPSLLKELSKFFQRQSQTKQKITSALIYPSILVCVAILLFLVVVLYLAPNLEPIFSSVDRETPTTLGFLLWVNSVLREFSPFIVPGVILAFLGLLISMQLPAVREVVARLRFKLPILGTLSRLSLLSRLVQSTELLLLSGETLSQALRISGQNMGAGSAFGARFIEAADAVERGFSAADVFDGERFFPPSFQELFRIGEKTNSLPTTLAAMSTFFSEQLDHKSERVLNLVTPVLTLILGLGVGILVYTLMGAILEVNEIVL